MILLCSFAGSLDFLFFIEKITQIIIKLHHLLITLFGAYISSRYFYCNGSDSAWYLIEFDDIARDFFIYYESYDFLDFCLNLCRYKSWFQSIIFLFFIFQLTLQYISSAVAILLLVRRVDTYNQSSNC